MLHELPDRRHAMYWCLGLLVLLAAAFATFRPPLWAQEAKENVAGPSAQPAEPAGAAEAAAAPPAAARPAPAADLSLIHISEPTRPY